MKLTGWYSGDQKPARVGVYERRYVGKSSNMYSYWNGVFWGIDLFDKALASRLRMNSIDQARPWRGIAK